MKLRQLSATLLIVCWCSSSFSADTAEQGAPDMHAMHEMGLGTLSSVGMANPGLEFELVSGDGKSVTNTEFLGKNVLLAFGFTQCVAVCPLIAANMANTLKITDKDSVGIFISVDNERDTPAITQNYASHFGPRMIGLSGSYEQLAAAAKNYNVSFAVTKTQDTYTVQHSAGIFLLGPDGKLIDVFAINTAPEDIAAAMR